MSLWRCFHCDELFTDASLAREHFGTDELSVAACRLSPEDVRALRALEQQNAELRAENEQLDHEAGGYHAMTGELERYFGKGVLSPHQAWLRLEAKDGAIEALQEQMNTHCACQHDERGDLTAECDEHEQIREERDRLLALIDTPEIHDFAKAVTLEAAHQRERWPTGHDSEKADENWFWLIGYLAGKALHTPIAKDYEKLQRHIEERDSVEFGLTVPEIRKKQLHRIITVAAAAANWHAHVKARTT